MSVEVSLLKPVHVVDRCRLSNGTDCEAALVQQHDDRLHAAALEHARVVVGGRGLVGGTPGPRRRTARRRPASPSSVMPMKPIFAPPTLTDLVGREERLAGARVDTTLAARYWNWRRERRCRPGSRRPGGSRRRLHALQLVLALVELVVADARSASPSMFIASIVGSSWNSAESSGLAPIMSPARDDQRVALALARAAACAWRGTRRRPPARRRRRARPVGVVRPDAAGRTWGLRGGRGSR